MTLDCIILEFVYIEIIATCNIGYFSLNDSGDYSSMEVECDPLSMLDTSQESVDTKDFLIDVSKYIFPLK